MKAIITVFLSLITVTCIIFEFSPKKIKEFMAIRLRYHIKDLSKVDDHLKEMGGHERYWMLNRLKLDGRY